MLGLSRGLAAARDNDYVCLSQPRMRLTVLHGEGVASRLPTWRAAGLTQWTVSAVRGQWRSPRLITSGTPHQDVLAV